MDLIEIHLTWDLQRAIPPAARVPEQQTSVLPVQTTNSQPVGNASRPVLPIRSARLVLVSPAIQTVQAAPDLHSISAPAAHPIGPCLPTADVYQPAANLNFSTRHRPPARRAIRAARVAPDLVRVVV